MVLNDSLKQIPLSQLHQIADILRLICNKITHTIGYNYDDKGRIALSLYWFKRFGVKES